MSTVQNGTTVARPAGTMAGDLLLATLEIDAASVAVKPPRGWTLLLDTPAALDTPSAFHAQVWYKIAHANEPPTYTWRIRDGVYTDISVLAYTNVDPQRPFDGALGRFAGWTATPSTPSLLTSVANTRLVALFHNFAYGPWTAPAGMTERVDFDSNGVMDTVQASPGQTGAKTATNATQGATTAQLIALRPRPAAIVAGAMSSPDAVAALQSAKAPTAEAVQTAASAAPATASGDHAPARVLANVTAAAAAAAVQSGGASKASRTVPDAPAAPQRTLLETAGDAVGGVLKSITDGANALRLKVLLMLEDLRGAPNAADLHSKWVAQSANVAVTPGEITGELVLSVRNTGSRSWVRGRPAQQVNLGVAADALLWSTLSVEWPTADRVAVQRQEIVAPGEIAQFVFRLRAPEGPGTFYIRLRPVVDGVAWLEDEGIHFVVTVAP